MKKHLLLLLAFTLFVNLKAQETTSKKYFLENKFEFAYVAANTEKNFETHYIKNKHYRFGFHPQIQLLKNDKWGFGLALHHIHEKVDLHFEEFFVSYATVLDTTTLEYTFETVGGSYNPPATSEQSININGFGFIVERYLINNKKWNFSIENEIYALQNTYKTTALSSLAYIMQQQEPGSYGAIYPTTSDDDNTKGKSLSIGINISPNVSYFLNDKWSVNLSSILFNLDFEKVYDYRYLPLNTSLLLKESFLKERGATDEQKFNFETQLTRTFLSLQYTF